MPENDEVVALDVPWVPSAGTPHPVLCQTEHGAVLVFNAAISTGHHGERVVVRLSGCLASQFGYPNDEALPGHLLWARGLSHYGVFEVLQSSWLARLAAQNQVAFPAKAWPFRPYRHLIVTFHDSTFECLVVDFAGQFTSDTVEAILVPLISARRRQS